MLHIGVPLNVRFLRRPSPEQKAWLMQLRHPLRSLAYADDGLCSSADGGLLQEVGNNADPP